MMTSLTMEQAAKIWKSYQNTTTHLITTTTVQPAQAATLANQGYSNQLNQVVAQAQFNVQISRDYGEQCADTDGLAASGAWDPLAYQLEQAQALAIKLTARAEQAERNLETAIKERDALQVELNQRMAMPARALRYGV